MGNVQKVSGPIGASLAAIVLGAAFAGGVVAGHRAGRHDVDRQNAAEGAGNRERQSPDSANGSLLPDTSAQETEEMITVQECAEALQTALEHVECADKPDQPARVIGTLGEFQGLLGGGLYHATFVIPFTEMRGCNVKGSPLGRDPLGGNSEVAEDPALSWDETGVWISRPGRDPKKVVEVYCLGVRGGQEL